MTQKTFADRLREDRRLVLLRLLAEQNGYRANSSTLHSGLHHLAVAGSRDDVLTDLTWLGEQGLLRVSEVVPGVLVAELTIRGQDAASGMTAVPGVSRPSAR
ncbi:MAG: VpaChn25_0724 family phage protein [Stenotrophomonas sp.]|uniref:VpaChn25_0724 family phage protein n=1 Tax=Stenotrophomonas sp. TaxID=69392 RepID=UPI003D6CB98C